MLLHVCCGPCAALPILGDEWKQEDITGLFYNPNIHPSDEFARRMNGAAELFEKARLPLIIKDNYMQREWELFEESGGCGGSGDNGGNGGSGGDNGGSGDKNARCEMCYTIRMSYTAATAKEKGFDAFSTTLLVSPYQNRCAIISICESLSKQYSVSFACWDGRPRFREGQKIAQKLGLYRQKYCGCIFSMRERNNSVKHALFQQ